ncbi:MAG: hypothetical protein ACKVY0_25895 [Prosthecobacter sp.]|uniref:hypothetical protein n=1 Tax=Prosthecobacter sp. TaxID=1965333 RepID=UPI0039045D65
MKRIVFFALALSLGSLHAQSAAPLDTAAAKATLSTRIRNPAEEHRGHCEAQLWP